MEFKNCYHPIPQGKEHFSEEIKDVVCSSCLSELKYEFEKNAKELEEQLV